MSTNKPLNGYKVVELTTYVAAPMCGRLLATWGADVIKVESLSGDVWRGCGPTVNVPYDEKENPIFDVGNSGKKSITINLKNEEGLELFHSLLADADIFLTNNRPQALKKMKLDYETLKVKYPKMIFAAITGYGEEGPDKDLPGFDIIAYWSRCGFLVDLADPHGYPAVAPSGYGDTVSGTTLFGGITAALLGREKTGKGDYVGVSLYGTSIWAASNMVICNNPRYSAKYPRERYDCNPMISPYRCSDGQWVMIAVIDYMKHFNVLCSTIGIPEVGNDPRFATLNDMMAHCKEFFELAEPAFAKFDSQTIGKKLVDAGIVNDIMHHFKDISNDPHAFANNYIQEVTWPSGGTSVMTMPPYNCESLGKLEFEVGPLRGEHTDQILLSHGHSLQAIAEMKAKSII